MYFRWLQVNYTYAISSIRKGGNKMNTISLGKYGVFCFPCNYRMHWWECKTSNIIKKYGWWVGSWMAITFMGYLVNTFQCHLSVCCYRMLSVCSTFYFTREMLWFISTDRIFCECGLIIVLALPLIRDLVVLKKPL